MLALPISAQLGPALAGRMAQAENAAVVNQNPAGLTRIPEWQLVIDTIAAVSVNEFDVDESRSGNAGGDPDNDPEFAAIPQIAASYAIGDLRLGFGFSVPQGFGTAYGNDWAGRYLADETSLVFLSAQPALAYRVTDWLSVGGGVSIMYVSSEVKQNIRNLAPNTPDGRFQLDVDGVAVGPVLSLLLEPTSKSRLGVSWRGEIEPELDGEPNFRNLGPVLEAALDAAGLLGKNIDIDMRVPQTVQAGFYHELGHRWALMGDVTWIDWSRFGRVDISVGSSSTTFTTDYKDIWIGSLGAQYTISDTWKAGVGFSYVSSGVEDEDRSIGLPMDEFFIPAIGAQYAWSDTLEIHSNLMAVIGGDGAVDQSPSSGRLVGKFDTRLSFAFQVSIIWGRRPGATTAP